MALVDPLLRIGAFFSALLSLFLIFLLIKKRERLLSKAFLQGFKMRRNLLKAMASMVIVSLILFGLIEFLEHLENGLEETTMTIGRLIIVLLNIAFQSVALYIIYEGKIRA